MLLPYSLVGPFAGVLLDRWWRQRVLVIANLLRAVLVLGVAAEVAAGVDNEPFYISRARCRVGEPVLPLGVVRVRSACGRNARSWSRPMRCRRHAGGIAATLGGAFGIAVRALDRRYQRGLRHRRRAGAAALPRLGADAPAASGGPRSAPTTCTATTGRRSGRSSPDWWPAPATSLAMRPVYDALRRDRRYIGSATASSRSRTLLLYRNYLPDDGFFRSRTRGSRAGRSRRRGRVRAGRRS